MKSSEENIRILFAGDFAPCRQFEAIVLEKKHNVFGDALKIIETADISFINLECPLTNASKPIKKSGPALKAKQECSEVISVFTVAGLANNHCMDFGEKGLLDTIKACNEQGIKTVGAGANLEEAQKPLFLERKGIKIAIIALAEFEFNQSENGGPGSAPIDLVDNYKQIQQAKLKSDFIILTLHGGNEYFPYPSPGLRKLCQHYIDLGVDAVVCHHPHIPGAYEYYNQKPIFYSIGNFIFDHTKPPYEWNLGNMIEFVIDINSKNISAVNIIPYKQSVEHGGIKLLKNKSKEDFLKKIESYRAILGSEQEWLTEWGNFVQEKTNNYILRQYLPFNIRGLNRVLKIFPNLILLLFSDRKKDLDRLNVIRCQSHLEMLEAVMRKKLNSLEDD